MDHVTTVASHTEMKLPPLSLYIHIPWCVQKCPYCDFNSHTLKGEIPEVEYIQALLQDLRSELSRVYERQLHSIFIGGGTPSLISAAGIKTLLTGVAEMIPFSDTIEITMEANPGTVEAERFHAYVAAGVNRISIGVQSLQAEKLNLLGRIHDPQEAIRAAQIATSSQLNSFNLDLMHGLPHQDLSDALYDLNAAVELAPPHLSWYQLTIEQNTQYYSKPPTLPDEDVLWDIFEQGHALLSAAGYEQYEISGYAKIGKQCRHNLNYWRFGDYIGIGCGAHGKLTEPKEGKIYRRSKIKHPRGYMDANKPFLDDEHTVVQDELPFEFIMNRFRLLEPTPKQDFSDFTGLALTVIAPQINTAIKKGLLTETETHWQVTKLGHRYLNSLFDIFL
jgi:putative oxygen-independent coproporphyrinogen III oxidase